MIKIDDLKRKKWQDDAAAMNVRTTVRKKV